MTGASVKLHVEALGWPMPSFQWRISGANIPGATSTSYEINGFDPAQAGQYSVIVSNPIGATTSMVARVTGFGSLPQIISEPSDLVKQAGETAVLEVAASSSNLLSYQWFHAGIALTNGTANAQALLLTNLSVEQGGEYFAVVGNSSGVVTSAVARLTVLQSSASFTLVSTGAVWRYWDVGSEPDSTWYQPGYQDAGWAAGPAQLGYGDGDEQTVVSYGPDPEQKYPTTYFRAVFQSPEGFLPTSLQGRLLCDDGAIIYLNGAEIYRVNMPAGPGSYGTYAVAAVDGAGEASFATFSIPTWLFLTGTNVLAAEVHQNTSNSDDLSFAMELAGTFDQLPVILSPPAGLVLQSGASASFSVKAASETPVSYRWFHDGVEITGATNANFFLGGVTPAQNGSYSVTVSNAAGSVASSPAALTVIILPLWTATWAQDRSSLTLEIPGQGVAQTILVSTNLEAWQELQSLPPSFSPTSVVITNAPEIPARFFRLRVDY